MRPALILLSAVVLSLAAPAPISAWEWPIRPVLITGGFGGETPDGFRKGVLLRGSDSKVGSVADGQVIFADRRDQRVGSLPSGLGDFVVIQHPQGFRSVYAHLAPGSFPAGMRQVTEGQSIGTTGESGRTDTSGLTLGIVDMKSNQCVNPLALLPPVTDRRSPVIRNVELSDRMRIPLGETTTVASAHWAVEAEIFDEIEGQGGSSPIAPFGIDLSVNQKTVSSIRFISLEFRQGMDYIDPRYRWSYDNFYLGRHTYNLGLVDLSPGMNTIKITAYDFAGNQTELERQVYFGQVPGPAASPTAQPSGDTQATAQ